MQHLSSAMAAALSLTTMTAATFARDVTVNKAKTADKAFHLSAGPAHVDTTGRYGAVGSSFVLENFSLAELGNGSGQFGDNGTSMSFAMHFRVSFEAVSLSNGQVSSDSFDLSMTYSGGFDSTLMHGSFGGLGLITANQNTLAGIPLFEMLQAGPGSIRVDLSKSWSQVQLFETVTATFVDMRGLGVPLPQLLFGGAFGGGSIEGSFTDGMNWTRVPAPGAFALGGVSLVVGGRRRRRKPASDTA